MSAEIECLKAEVKQTKVDTAHQLDTMAEDQVELYRQLHEERFSRAEAEEKVKELLEWKLRSGI
jgi:hypothetical protein